MAISTEKGYADELAMQLPLIKEVLEAMNIPIIECEGYEADDVIGSIYESRKENFDVLILTGDRDSFQLISEKVSNISSTKAEDRN